MANRFESVNCSFCGEEFFSAELSTIKLANYDSAMRICVSCKDKDPEQHYKTAVLILKDIASITEVDLSPEDRIQKIRKLLGE